MKITVRYWRSTLQLEATATTYRGALRIASRNRNAYPPRFYDPEGRELFDDGQGLAYPDDEPDGARTYAV